MNSAKFIKTCKLLSYLIWACVFPVLRSKGQGGVARLVKCPDHDLEPSLFLVHRFQQLSCW